MSLDIIGTEQVWWNLFKLFTAVGLVIAGGVTIFYLYTLVRYRSREATGPPKEVEEEGGQGAFRILVESPPKGASKVVLLLTGIIVFSLIVATIDDTIYLEFTPTEDAFPVWVTGFQFGWKFEYNVDGESVVSTGLLVLPSDTVVEFKVTSSDVYHTFGIPEFKVKIDAIPGILNTMWIKTPEGEGVYEVYTAYCYELCGIGHSFMTAKVVVVDKERFFEAYNGGPEEFRALIEEVSSSLREG